MIYLLNPFDELHTFFCESIQNIFSSPSRIISSIEMALSTSFQKEDIVIYTIHPLYILQNEECKKLFHQVQHVKCKTILYVSEPLTLRYDQHAYQKILNTFKIWQLWTYNLSNVKKLHLLFKKRLYQPILYIPPYPHSLYWIPFDKIDIQKKENNKMVWIGNKTESRREVLDLWGNDLVHLTNIWKKEDWIQVLATYLYFINVHRIPKCPCLETFRIIPILMNGGIVISEEVDKDEMEKWRDMNIYFGKREELYDIWKKIQIQFSEDPSIYQKAIYKIRNHAFSFDYEEIQNL